MTKNKLDDIKLLEFEL